MTKRVYKTAQGKMLDLGAVILQNETVRAVGNMNVNARGDLLDNNNRVIDQKNAQVTRQHNRLSQPAITPLSNQPLHSSTLAARQSRVPKTPQAATTEPIIDPNLSPESVADTRGAVTVAQQEKLKSQDSVKKPTPGENTA